MYAYAHLQLCNYSTQFQCKDWGVVRVVAVWSWLDSAVFQWPSPFSLSAFGSLSRVTVAAATVKHHFVVSSDCARALHKFVSWVPRSVQVLLNITGRKSYYRPICLLMCSYRPMQGGISWKVLHMRMALFPLIRRLPLYIPLPPHHLLIYEWSRTSIVYFLVNRIEWEEVVQFGRMYGVRPLSRVPNWRNPEKRTCERWLGVKIL